MKADPRPDARVVDPKASLRKLLRDPWCRACGDRAINCHHLLGRGGMRGDDVEDNLIPLCGSGAHGCHGALHGNAYIDRHGRRWDPDVVRRAIGLGVTPKERLYVVSKLGSAAASSYLERRYGLGAAA